MDEWAVAVILIGMSVFVAAGLVAACRLLGGWTYLYAWVTGNKEERANLANHEEFNGYAVYPPNLSDRRFDPRPPFFDPQSFSNNLKSAEQPQCIADPPKQKQAIIHPLPPPPNDPHPRRFSIEIGRRISIDAAELPDVLTSVESGSPRLQRAMSCDSVCSDTSVVLETLDSPQTTGELELEVDYSRESEELMVLVKSARGLKLAESAVTKLDSYIRVCLEPDQSTCKQTGVQHVTEEPKYNEKLTFPVRMDSIDQKVLRCLVYASDKYSNNLIGETELKLSTVNFNATFHACLPIVDVQQKNKGSGELLFSLSYLPTAERLTVVLVKARNLVWADNKLSADPFVKVYLLQKGKKISKKKTSVKKGERNPTFNEAMIFSVPSSALQNIQLRLTMSEYQADGKTPEIGHVFVGPQCAGKQLSHWNQMISSPRKPIAMWHPLRKREH